MVNYVNEVEGWETRNKTLWSFVYEEWV